MIDTISPSKVTKGLMAALALILLGGGLTACNTVAGAGKDVSAAGDAVSGTSDAAKAKLPDAPKP